MAVWVKIAGTNSLWLGTMGAEGSDVFTKLFRTRRIEGTIALSVDTQESGITSLLNAVFPDQGTITDVNSMGIVCDPHDPLSPNKRVLFPWSHVYKVEHIPPAV